MAVPGFVESGYCQLISNFILAPPVTSGHSFKELECLH
ncbi:MAG: hypothetical protein OFPI_37230 [Osedax symbiont Rs2]|nr:MAG: hypothetical protein OFPI_37230 [Osedax symbiont Rs2]